MWTKLKPYLIDIVDTVTLAIRCLAAQWLGIGAKEDFCGSCMKCTLARYIVVACALIVAYLVVPTLLFIGLGIWAAWGIYSGKGWLGAYIHAKIWGNVPVVNPPVVVLQPPAANPPQAPTTPPSV